ncbi:hypothetical protein ACFQ3Z_43175 [Streptomyces nogalater]
MTGTEPEVRLFCLPHAGGGGAFFHPWRAALAPASRSARWCCPAGRAGSASCRT